MLMRRFVDEDGDEDETPAEDTIIIDVESVERGGVRRRHSQYDTILVQEQRPRKRPTVARKLYLAWLQFYAMVFAPLLRPVMDSRVARWWNSLGEEEEGEEGEGGV